MCVCVCVCIYMFKLHKGLKKKSIQLKFYVCVVKKNDHNYNLQNYSFMENMCMLKMR